MLLLTLDSRCSSLTLRKAALVRRWRRVVGTSATLVWEQVARLEVQERDLAILSSELRVVAASLQGVPQILLLLAYTTSFHLTSLEVVEEPPRLTFLLTSLGLTLATTTVSLVGRVDLGKGRQLSLASCTLLASSLLLQVAARVVVMLGVVVVALPASLLTPTTSILPLPPTLLLLLLPPLLHLLLLLLLHHLAVPTFHHLGAREATLHLLSTWWCCLALRPPAAPHQVATFYSSIKTD